MADGETSFPRRAVEEIRRILGPYGSSPRHLRLGDRYTELGRRYFPCWSVQQFGARFNFPASHRNRHVLAPQFGEIQLDPLEGRFDHVLRIRRFRLGFVRQYFEYNISGRVDRVNSCFDNKM